MSENKADVRCPISAFITNLGKYNEGELIGQWVSFPTSAEEMQRVLSAIGIGKPDACGVPYEEWFIIAYTLRSATTSTVRLPISPRLTARTFADSLGPARHTPLA